MKKLVIVDDDSDDIHLFREAVLGSGHSCECYSAKHGKDLLSQLASGSIVEPYLIFLDINMPEMNGWECLAKLKEGTKYQHIPVLMYSTSSAASDVTKAVELGAIGFYKKPPSYDQLKRFLLELLSSERLDKQSVAELLKSHSKTTGLLV